MIECYYSACEYHDTVEPFCTLTKCVVTDERILALLQAHRKLQLKLWSIEAEVEEYQKNDY